MMMMNINHQNKKGLSFVLPQNLILFYSDRSINPSRVWGLL